MLHSQLPWECLLLGICLRVLSALQFVAQFLQFPQFPPLFCILAFLLPLLIVLCVSYAHENQWIQLPSNQRRLKARCRAVLGARLWLPRAACDELRSAHGRSSARQSSKQLAHVALTLPNGAALCVFLNNLLPLLQQLLDMLTIRLWTVRVHAMKGMDEELLNCHLFRMVSVPGVAHGASVASGGSHLRDTWLTNGVPACSAGGGGAVVQRVVAYNALVG